MLPEVLVWQPESKALSDARNRYGQISVNKPGSLVTTYGLIPAPRLMYIATENGLFPSTREMMHPLQSAFLERYGSVRGAEFSAELTASAALHGDLYCEIDEDQGGTTLKLRSRPGILAEIEAGHTGQPRWLVLRLELGQGQVIPGDVLGVVMRGAINAPGLETGVYLRRNYDGIVVDTRFDEKLVLPQKPGVVTALHTVSAHDPAIGDPAQFALVLGLTLSACRIEIEDLGFFVLPAAMGLRSKPVDFAAFAA